MITIELSAQKNKIQEKIIGSWQQTKVIYNPNSKERHIDISNGFTLEIKENGTFIKRVEDSEVPIIGYWELLEKENDEATYFKTATGLGLLAGLAQNDKIIKIDATHFILEQEINEEKKITLIQYHYKRANEIANNEIVVRTDYKKDLEMIKLRDSLLSKSKLTVFSNTLLRYLKDTQNNNLDSIIFNKKDFMEIFNEKIATVKGEEKVKLINEINNFCDKNKREIYSKFYDSKKNIFQKHSSKINRNNLKIVNIFIIDTKLPKTEFKKRGNRFSLAIFFSDDVNHIVLRLENVLLWSDKLIISGDNISFWFLDEIFSYNKAVSYFNSLEKDNLKEIKELKKGL